MSRWITALVVTVVLTGAATACGGSNKPVADTGTVPITFSGGDIYAQKCAICHGARGEGGAGPRLAGQVAAAKFPRVENEETYVRDGNKSMPAFGGSLTTDQIRAVVAFTRQL